jgi:hypothetical protein
MIENNNSIGMLIMLLLYRDMGGSKMTIRVIPDLGALAPTDFGNDHSSER